MFSERYGYIEKPLQIESMTDALRNRIWNTYRAEIDIEPPIEITNYLQEIMDVFGLAFSGLGVNASKDLKAFQSWFMQADWYRIYDFVEVYLQFLPSVDRKTARDNLNSVLKAENAGYRIIGNNVVPITNSSELTCIEQAEQTEYSSVNTHIQKAVELFSRKPSPDYENSIKESISAVEAMCGIITGLSGPNATLGKTIKKLKDCGIHIL